MAPPRHRDRGFSRRIQYGLFFGYVAAAVGIVVGLALILIARFYPLAFEGARGMALDATTPVSSIGRPIVRGGSDIGSEIGAYFGAASQNRALRAELAQAQRGLIESRRLAFENARLRQLLRLVEQGTRPVVTARIVGSGLSGSRRFATLAAGSSDGVTSGQPVRGADGLVGRVAETGSHAARIVLLTDGGSSVPLRVVRTGEPALAEGRGEGTIEVHATIAGTQHFQRGDLLVTSGVGGVFPPDLPVAVVTAISGEVARARPLADPAKLDFAMVLPVAAAPPPLTPPAGRPR
jgi:rod shape-determining protein MreC